jgi:predicted Rossmann fold nucleotide-binding protein DprA/Smf involved in DNA uptake
MARNPIIYALADEIYIAETSEKGGTWAGAIDGLRRGRKIFVRHSDSSETNANNLLIEKGAIPVDIEGKEIEFASSYNTETIQRKLLKEERTSLTDTIYFALSDRMLSIGQLEKELKLSRKVLKDTLEKLENIEVVKKGNRKYYRIKDKRKEPGLFD